jgi:transcriptional regulator with XRE-family HTH domain
MRFKTLRENAGPSQVEVSKLTGMSTTRLSLAENHFASLTPKNKAMRSKALKMSIRRWNAWSGSLQQPSR